MGKIRVGFSESTSLSRDKELLRSFALGLYYGEGTKSGRSVDFTNTDPVAIRIWMKFLREIMGVDEGRIRVHLQLKNGDHGLEDSTRYWSDVSGVPISQFIKPSWTDSNQKHVGSHGGVCRIRVSDTTLLRRILSMIKDMAR